jgi:hypothetical protein
LAEDLQGVNLVFEPDLVIATSQNSLLALIFSKTRCLWMEQALFPRRKGQGRVYFDPVAIRSALCLSRPQERLGLLAFLSHRYTLTFAEIANPAGPFRAHLRALLESPDPVE